MIFRTISKKTVTVSVFFLLVMGGIFLFWKHNHYKADTVEQPIAQINISIPDQKNKINPYLFSSNLSTPALNNTAVNKDNTSLGIKPEYENLISQLNIPMQRFNSGEGWYRWWKSIGPVSYRKANPIISGSGNNYIGYFGIDEYIAEAKKLGTKDIYISVNYAGGLAHYDTTAKKIVGTYSPGAGAQEAANWVEYCNGIVPTNPNPTWTTSSYTGDQVAPAGYFAWLRAQYGHTEPYAVKYWEIGNEVYWAERYVDGFATKDANGVSDNGANNYGNDVVTFSQKMKAVDPSIKIGVVVVEDILNPYTNWNDIVLSKSASAVDFASTHIYKTLMGLSFASMYSTSQAVTRNITVPSDGTYSFKILARGQPADEGSGYINPKLELKIDGAAVQTWDVGINMQFCQYAGNLTTGNHTVKLTFLNDYSNPATSQDRNLFVYKANFNNEDILFPKDTEQQWLFYDQKIKSDVLDALKDKLTKYSPDRKISIMVTEGGSGGFDEYATFNGVRSDATVTSSPDYGPEYSLRMGSALWLSGFLNLLIERGDIDSYNHWETLDSGYWGMVRYYFTTAGSLRLQNDNVTPYSSVTPIYYLMKMYHQYADWYLLNASINSPEFIWPTGLAAPTAIPSGVKTVPSGVKYLDAVSAQSLDGKKISVIVTNRSDKTISTAINLASSDRVTGASGKQLKVVALGDHSNLSDAAKMVRNFDPNFDAHNEIQTVDGSVPKQPIVPDNVATQDIALTNITNSGISSIDLPADSVTAIEFDMEAVPILAITAGADKTIYPSQKIAQSAVITSAGAGITSWNWSKTSGPGTVTFGSATAQTTTISVDQPGTYMIGLTAADSAGQVATSTMKLTVNKMADINGDGKINTDDFTLLLFNWGVPKNPLSDFNGNSTVDNDDFTIMLYWLGK